MAPLMLDSVSAHMRRQPDAIALDLNGETLTYAEVERRASSVAAALTAAGVGVGEVVGVLTQRDLNLVPALLGVLYSGAAYLPIDPRNSPAQAVRLLDVADSRLVLTADTLRHRLEAAPKSVNVVPLDEAVRRDGVVAPVPVASGDPAYVIFTSGSTGSPKGVVVPHGALANHAQAMVRLFDLSPADRVLQFATIGFDVAAEEIFPTLVAGGCVVLCPDAPDPRELSRTLNDGGITVANLASSYWQQWRAGLDGGVIPQTLRLVVIGSEGVDAGAVASWCRSTEVPLINAYGLTETTITSLVHRIDAVHDAMVVPAGRPIDGVTAYVLDSELSPVADGTEGELYIGGLGVASGYLRCPEETAQRFVPDPFSDVTDARMHRTGDRARRRRDGAIEVLGRLDEQVKINGHRVEPAQVEAALSAHPLVAFAAAAVRPGPDGRARLVGYVVRCDADAGVPADLRTHLADLLPAYLLPDTLVAVSELPVTSSGKLDRSALPDADPFIQRAPAVSPRTSMESRLLTVWCEVLGIDDIGIRDNFFDVGGTSATLAAVLSKINDIVAEPIGLLTLFEHPTIVTLAAHLTQPISAASPSARRPRSAARRRRTAR